jgi:PPE-repeat protein
MDFGALPPEINSARMYLGPGSDPMLAAAAAWDGLAAELNSTASSYQSMITRLTDEGWMGPASASMVAAIAPYLTWMSGTGATAEQAAAQAAAAAAAFEAAFAMTVPPAAVAANRSQLAALVATNVIGQNTPAIAANEAQYGEMWAQDAAAMYGYAANSAAVTKLKTFTLPPQTTSPTGQSQQSAAVAHATGNSTASGTQTQLAQFMSTSSGSLQGLSSPSTSTGSFGDLLNFLDGADGNPIGTFLNSNFLNGFTSAGYINPAIIVPAVTSGLSNINSLGASGAGAVADTPFFPGWASLVRPDSAGGMPFLGGTSAHMAQSTLVGRLSVPQAWTAAAQVENHSGVTFAGGGWTDAVGPAGTAEAVPAGMPGMPGMSMAGAGGRGFGHGPRYGFPVTVMPRPPAAG